MVMWIRLSPFHYHSQAVWWSKAQIYISDFVKCAMLFSSTGSRKSASFDDHEPPPENEINIKWEDTSSIKISTLKV
ncbi:hypothetical protein YC2023_043543 [Brassica napus]